MNGIGRPLPRLAAGLAFALSAGSAAAEAVDVSRSGFLQRVSIVQDVPAIGARLNLGVDVEWTYRATTLMGDPVVNCGLRVRGVQGRVWFRHEGAEHSVDVTPANEDSISVVTMAFVMDYYRSQGPALVIHCDPGVIARGEGEPFNVPSGLTWARAFCVAPPPPRSGLPARLEYNWCEQGLGGRWFGAEEARRLYRNEVAHRIATPRIAAATLGVTQLVIKEQARLRAEAAEEAEAAAEAETTEAETAEATERLDAATAALAYARLAEIRRTPDPPSPATTAPTDIESRRLAEARAAVTARFADATRDAEEAHAGALARCTADRDAARAAAEAAASGQPLPQAVVDAAMAPVLACRESALRHRAEVLSDGPLGYRRHEPEDPYYYASETFYYATPTVHLRRGRPVGYDLRTVAIIDGQVQEHEPPACHRTYQISLPPPRDGLSGLRLSGVSWETEELRPECHIPFGLPQEGGPALGPQATLPGCDNPIYATSRPIFRVNRVDGRSVPRACTGWVELDDCTSMALTAARQLEEARQEQVRAAASADRGADTTFAACTTRADTERRTARAAIDRQIEDATEAQVLRLRGLDALRGQMTGGPR